MFSLHCSHMKYHQCSMHSFLTEAHPPASLALDGLLYYLLPEEKNKVANISLRLQIQRCISAHCLLSPQAPPAVNLFCCCCLDYSCPRKCCKFIYPNFNWSLGTTTITNHPCKPALESYSAATGMKNFFHRVPTGQDLCLSICFCYHSFLYETFLPEHRCFCYFKVIDSWMAHYFCG